MVPFLLLLSVTLTLRGLGSLGVQRLESWRPCVRFALAAMFGFTGATHFTAMRHDYALMVPEVLPRPMLLVALTGALELLGAVGLLVPRWRRAAGTGLVLLLLAVFPANVHAALEGVPFRGGAPTSLWLRAPLQVVYLAAVWFAASRGRTGEERATESPR